MSVKSACLRDVAEFNPPTPRGLLATSDEVAFVPMAAVSELGTMRVQEHRPARSISPGLTYFSNDDVLVAKITPCYENNKITVVNIDRKHAFGSTEFHVLRPIAHQLNSSYLSHFLRQDSVRDKGTRRMTGSAGQRRVPKIFLEELEIPLPPLDEQRRIAAILDQADALRRKRRQTLSKVTGIERSLFLQRFGSPENNPRGFPIVDLGSLILDGPTNGLYKPASDYGSGTPILRIGDFYNGRVVNPLSLRRLRATEKEINAYELKPDDIVINRVNSREYLGKSALIPAWREQVVFESNMMRLRLNKVAIDPTFCISFLQLPFVKKQINQMTKDAINQSSINQKDVSSIKIMLPCLSEQKVFSASTSAIAALELGGRSHLAHLDTLFASLQHRAFHGEL